jgi:hypothetical protein
LEGIATGNRLSESTFRLIQRFSNSKLTGSNFKTLACGKQVVATVTTGNPDGSACASQNGTILSTFQPYQFSLSKTTFHD